MKYIISTVFILLVVILHFMFLPSEGNGYNILTGEIKCSGEFNCFHEVGHAVDVEGWISQTLEFQLNVDEFIQYCDTPWLTQLEIPYCNFMVSYPGFGTPLKEIGWKTLDFWLQGGWGGYLEIYADILAFANGKVDQMPNQFQEFYNQEDIDTMKIGIIQ